jgi:hypothetical protein
MCSKIVPSDLASEVSLVMWRYRIAAPIQRSYKESPLGNFLFNDELAYNVAFELSKNAHPNHRSP